jgi:pimeloyl-ACP methyl ester carboxylesterase
LRDIFLMKGAGGMTPASSPGRIELLNGMPIYFEVHGTGEPLLLLHGFSGCSQDWSACLKMQSEPGGCEFQLMIPDMRGHGRSFAAMEHSSSRTKSAQPGLAMPQEFSAWRHDESAADMFALLDHLGIKTFKGLGVSGGGNVLLHMATKQPERVKAMVLVSATSEHKSVCRQLRRYELYVPLSRQDYGAHADRTGRSRSAVSRGDFAGDG